MRQVLLVEDEVLVAMELESRLRRAGFGVLGPHVRVRDALRAIAAHPPDLAILDINLEGEKSEQIAEALLTAHVPFITLTGYSEQAIPQIYNSSPVMTKPYDMDALLKMLEGLDRPSVGYTL